MRNKRISAAKIAYGGVSTALVFLALNLAAVFPASYLGSVALSSVFVAISLIECGKVGAILVFSASAILGLFLIPDKSVSLLFVIFFGYYPIIKSLFEQLRDRRIEWGGKIFFSFLVIYFVEYVLSAIVLPGSQLIPNKALFSLLLCAFFVLYDIGLSRILDFYWHRVSQFLHR